MNNKSYKRAKDFNFFFFAVFKENLLYLTGTNAGGGGGTPYNGLYGEAPPERGTFFRFQVYKIIIIIINLYLYTKSYHFTWSS